MKQSAFSVVFEDPYLLVVDKAAGIHTAPLRHGERGTLLDEVVEKFPEIARLGGIKAVEPGLLHRLDRETSGLVVFARSAEAFDSLRDQFANGRAIKHYHAISGLTAGKEAGGGPLLIESRFAPYGPGRKRIRVVLPGEAGTRVLRKCAPGIYHTRAEAIPLRDGFFLVRATIARGFRHQVRAHLSFLGYPIVGDPLYGIPVPNGSAGRMYLHASGIDILHPATGLPLSVSLELPREFQAFAPA